MQFNTITLKKNFFEVVIRAILTTGEWESFDPVVQKKGLDYEII